MTSGITAYTTSFTPKCNGGTVAATGVTTAATAYDWFKLTGGGALATSYAAMSTSTAVGVQNKAFVATISNLARADLLPLVKAEAFASAIANPQTIIANAATDAGHAATNIGLSGLDAASKTALAAAYAADLSVITASVNRIKSLEDAIHKVGGSIDIDTGTATTGVLALYGATATLTSFTNAKTYLSLTFDPTTFAPNAMAALTASTYANAATMASNASAAATTVSGSTLVDNLNALVEMSAQNIFDLYCMEVQGYSSAGTSGNWASGSAPVGIVPGIDYEVHLTGNYQAGTAAAGTPGAPSAVTAFW